MEVHDNWRRSSHEEPSLQAHTSAEHSLLRTTSSALNRNTVAGKFFTRHPCIVLFITHDEQTVWTCSTLHFVCDRISYRSYGHCLTFCFQAYSRAATPSSSGLMLLLQPPEKRWIHSFHPHLTCYSFPPYWGKLNYSGWAEWRRNHSDHQTSSQGSAAILAQKIEEGSGISIARKGITPLPSCY